MQLLKTGIAAGGYGPGSYYPWIYLQMTILIPLMRPICERMSKWNSLVVLILISVVLELVCSLIYLPDYVYRLLCIRYVFLVWLGWIWVKEGISFNYFTVAASLLSLLAIVYFDYCSNQFEPWFYDTGWATHKWICYFWASFAFTTILYELYKIVKKSDLLKKYIMIIASASYEIFLVQMAYYALVPYSCLSFIGNEMIQFCLWFLWAFVLSLAGGFGIYKLTNIVQT